MLLTFFTCFLCAYHGGQPPTILPPFHAIDSFRRNEISLVDFQHQKEKKNEQCPTNFYDIGNFRRKVDVQYQTCKMPRPSFFWNMAAMLRDFVRTHAERTRPRAMLLATMTMKTQTHGFPIFYVRMTAMGSTLRPAMISKM